MPATACTNENGSYELDLPEHGLTTPTSFVGEVLATMDQL